MNERIKELANRAMVVREDGWSEFDANVFAELIVRECCVVMFADPRLGDVRSATRGCARSIKEHFGVEE
jgi:hypothetical protein